MICARILPLVLVAFTVIVGILCAEELPKKPPVNKDLTIARQQGWATAKAIVDQIESNKIDGFVGIDAWLRDYAQRTKGLDPSVEPHKWPKVDVDALTTHNPNFWRALYEIAPGDPGVGLLYAGILLGGGEATRAKIVLELHQFRPGIPKEVHQTLAALHAAARNVGRKTGVLIEEGIALFDKGDYSGAEKKYREALTLWPQSGWAYYELAYTWRTQEVIASGLKPTLPGPNQVVTRPLAELALEFSPKTKAAFARARRYSPFMTSAYDGDANAILRGRRAVADEILPAAQHLSEKAAPEIVDHDLKQLVEGCQNAGVHDIAMIARQILVARRGRFDASDHPIMVANLRKLVPGPQTEAILDRAAGNLAAFYRLVATSDQDAEPAPEKKFTFGRPVYIREKNDEKTFTVVVPVEAQKPEFFEPMVFRLAYVVFDAPIKNPPRDLLPVNNMRSLTRLKGENNYDVSWQVRSVREKATGTAHELSISGRMQYRAVGKQGVAKFVMYDIPDSDIGFFVLGDKDRLDSSVVVFRKKDFSVGSSDAAVRAAIAKLPKSDPSDKATPKKK